MSIQKVPEIQFESTNPAITSFADVAGKNVVLYFYPKDNTPGCTLESRDFSALQSEFAKLNTIILGVSRDSLASHDKFCAKWDLAFALVSDKDEQLCQYFDVLVKDNFLKKLIIGIERSTFLIDTEGNIRKTWRNVSAKGHALEVLEAVKLLSTSH